MKELIRLIFLAGNWLSFFITLVIIAFLLAMLQDINNTDLGGLLLSWLFCYSLLAVVMVFHFHKTGNVSIGIGVLWMFVSSFVAIIFIVLIEELVLSVLIPYDSSIKHNFFLAGFFQVLTVGLFNAFSIFLCSLRKKRG